MIRKSRLKFVIAESCDIREVLRASDGSFICYQVRAADHWNFQTFDLRFNAIGPSLLEVDGINGG